MPVKIVSPVRVVVRRGKHRFACEGGELGALETGAQVRFAAADVPPLVIRKEPGITASHFQMWNEKEARTSEFFASSYRWSVFTREIRVHYGNNDYLLVPVATWRRGYDLVDGKGRRILGFAPARPFGRDVTITIDKAETELACIVFTYYLARSTWLRSLWPGRAQGADARGAAVAGPAADASTQAAATRAAELAKAMMPPDTRKPPAAPATTAQERASR
ncbi:MAG TPA: hypothetical protein VKE69_02840 [Planctomycetota bacterium]|nr:hypothetical protein [Planctomycetota bacterium]